MIQNRSQTAGVKKPANPVDRYVGSRIRRQRMLMGVSQTSIAEGLGVTFQQIQKYENGINRVSASKLQMIADMLSTPVAFFFEGAPLSDLPSGQFSLAARISYAPDLYSTSECIALAKSFSQIKSGAVRGQLMHLIEELANLNEGTELAESLGQ